jgi:GDP-L-fucose synthase
MDAMDCTQNGKFNLDGARVFVAGHRGMVGNAIVRALRGENVEILLAGRDELDLTRQKAVEDWMFRNRPDVVIIAAAKVGGIQANATLPADFLYQNLMIEANLVHASHEIGVRKLMFLGSTSSYPKFSSQPMREEDLMTGPLDPISEPYAIAKIAGIKLCQGYRTQYGHDFISVQPSNLYGPGENYDLEHGHVLPALLRKAHEARRDGKKSLEVWGSGDALREFMHVDDFANAAIYLIKAYSGLHPINVGSGVEISIRGLAEKICKTVRFEGNLEFDRLKPDGSPRKFSDLSKLRKLGWDGARNLDEGLKHTYRDALESGSLHI